MITEFIEFIKSKQLLTELNAMVKQTGGTRTVYGFMTVIHCYYDKNPHNYISEILRLLECEDKDKWLRLIPEWHGIVDGNKKI